MWEGLNSREMCLSFSEMVKAAKVHLVNAAVDDLHQSCCNKPNIGLTNGGKIDTEFHYGKPERQHLLKHLSHELL